MTATDELCKMLDERGARYIRQEREGKGTLAGVSWEYPAGDDSTDVFVATVVRYGDHLRFRGYLTPEQAIAATLGAAITGETSDGYHTFNELYHHRAILFSVVVRDHKELAWKSKAHSDGTMYDGMFIVGIETPQGQATYHYDIDPYWDMFECKELDRAPEWDGHTPDDAIARIATLGDADATVGRQLDARLSNCTNGGRRLEVGE